jgi:hypothetical protein
MFSVYSGRECLGFVLCRGKAFEAFDRAEQSLGHFETAKEAASAVMKAAGTT